MPDLMNDAVKFEDLISKYSNFLVPSYEIKVDGNNIDSSINVAEIQTSVTIESKCGMCSMLISDCYDNMSKSIDNKITSTIKLGKTIEIALGYSDVNTTVFKGYIESIEYEFDESINLKITCLDGMSALMRNERRERKDITKSPSDLVKDILQSYSRVITDFEVTDIKNTGIQLVQSESDYNFIKNIADINNFEFFIFCGKAYFRKVGTKKGEIMTLEYGQNIISFNREISYIDLDITVLGRDEVNKKTITSSSKYKGDDVTSCFTEKRIIQDGDANNEAQGKLIADNLIERLKKKNYTAELVSIGIPELVAGRCIKIKDFDSTLDGLYYINEVVHSFEDGKYISKLSLSSF